MTTPTINYGPNHAKVQAVLRQMRKLSIEQWKIVRGKNLETHAFPTMFWRLAHDMANENGRIAEWHAAGEAASKIFDEAFPLATISGSWRNYRMQLAREYAEAAAQITTIGDLITTEAFETLTAPMRAIGLKFSAHR